MRSVLTAALISVAASLFGGASPANALDSACSDMYNPEYQTSRCNWQRNDDYMERQRQNDRMFGLNQPRAPAPALFGAMAYSPRSGSLGTTNNYSTRSEAEKDAMSQCNRRDCRIVAWYSRACAAIAVTSNGQWFAATGYNTQQARQRTYELCVREGGKNCNVAAFDCSR